MFLWVFAAAGVDFAVDEYSGMKLWASVDNSSHPSAGLSSGLSFVPSAGHFESSVPLAGRVESAHSICAADELDFDSCDVWCRFRQLGSVQPKCQMRLSQCFFLVYFAASLASHNAFATRPDKQRERRAENRDWTSLAQF